MSVAEYMAAQLRQPSGFFGRYVLVHLLNRINGSMNDLAFETLQLHSRDQVLEVGFGGGDLIARMVRVVNQGCITGVDFSQDAVDVCSRRFAKFIKAGIVDLYCAKIESLPFKPNMFTKACTVNTIYFWFDLRATLYQFHRVLQEEGILAVCFTPRTFMENRGNVFQHGFTLYEPEEVTVLLRETGFRDGKIVRDKHRSGECAVVVGKK